MSNQPSADKIQSADRIATKYAPRMSYAWLVIAGRELAAPCLVSDHEAVRIARVLSSGTGGEAR